MYWYCNQQFCIRWGCNLSSLFSVSNGVRQGGIMSPILFNVYMDYLSKLLNESNIGCKLNGTLCNHLMYADDTCILAPSPSALYKLLCICSGYAKDNTILFNNTKSKFMCCKPKSMSKLYVPDMYLNNEVLPYFSKVKYLGVFLDNCVQDDDDISRHIKAIYSRGNSMINKFKMCSYDVKLCLFKTYLSSVYGCQLWTLYKPSVFKKAIVAYNNVCRKMFTIARGESMSAFYVNNGLDSFTVLNRKNIGGFRKRLQDCDNMLVQNIVSSVFFYFHSSHSANWQRFLFT